MPVTTCHGENVARIMHAVPCGEEKTWCGEEKKWCGEENSGCGEENSWCGEEKKWCGEEKLYFGATVLRTKCGLGLVSHAAMCSNINV